MNVSGECAIQSASPVCARSTSFHDALASISGGKRQLQRALLFLYIHLARRARRASFKDAPPHVKSEDCIIQRCPACQCESCVLHDAPQGPSRYTSFMTSRERGESRGCSPPFGEAREAPVKGMFRLGQLTLDSRSGVKSRRSISQSPGVTSARLVDDRC